MRGRRFGGKALAAALFLAVLAACSDGVEVATGFGPAADDGLPPFCDDLDSIRGSVEGRPGVEDDELFAVVEGYGSALPSYGGIWYDAVRGTQVVSFTDEPEAHRAAIAELLPDDAAAFDVVRVERDQQELEALRDEMILAIRATGPGNAFGGGVRPDLNRLEINMTIADVEARRELAEMFPVDAICVSGLAEAPDSIDPDSVVLISDDPEPLVQCGSLPFELAALDQTPDFEEADHPIADALRRILAPDTQPHPSNSTGWRLLADDGGRALLAADDPNMEILVLELEDDTWTFTGSGRCDPKMVLPVGVGHVRWWLDPYQPHPGPDDKIVQVRVEPNGCGAETFLDRIVGPQVVLTDTEVQIAFAALRPPPGPPCAGVGTDGERVVVDLGEPLGDRVVVDALDAPPRIPVADREW